MLTKRVTIGLEEGLQARPAARFVQQASAYQSQLMIERNGHVANMKSIMGVMSMAPACGEQLLLKAEGSDAEEALKTLAALVEEGKTMIK
ncbi:HPr family phosphocarrier protein [Sporolactobacillus inulinus]|uniref:PTS sugar transporter subunit IIA n=1 Tax=Sporolactobacillus inulinus CASD TaxID=1069536 RepID=A0A0U1QLH7_9BACL|nr:HPr family phosphocarrier protein [Sporolactobacillus inulinus]KLI01476.1 PTS sugar transporter subunit IIA [Sporolactobacillus inulinus CASD]GEB76878.1 phosphocarrier protein HPr [Sporolactobacillus inulinus]